jgi:hypothetical protein
MKRSIHLLDSAAVADEAADVDWPFEPLMLLVIISG